MSERRSDQVDQAFFGWSHQDQNLTLLYHSFQQEGELRKCLPRLGAHIRLKPVHGQPAPQQALTYVDYDDDRVAIVRRFNFGYSEGRNNSHALIGSAALLDLPVALGLNGWPGWQSKPPQTQWMQTLSAAALIAAAEPAKRFRFLAEQREHELKAVLARLIERPGAPLSIVGCPDDDRLAMVWALHEAADEYLREQCDVTRRWSFSSYEHRHDVNVEQLPEIIFLPVMPEGAAAVNRTIVDLEREPVPCWTDDHAKHLVDRLLRGIPVPVQETVSTHSGAAYSDGAFAGQPSMPPQEFQPAGNDGLPGQKPQRAEVPAGGPPGPSQASNRRGEEHPATVLRRIGSVREFQAAMTQLPLLGHTRAKLRAALDVSAVDAAAEFIEVGARQELHEKLLKVLYGPEFEDFRERGALDHAASIVKDTRFEQLATMVGKAAARTPVGRQMVSDAAFNRWANAGSSTGLIPNGRIARSLRWARRSRHLSLVAVVAALALLAAAFLVGFIVGRPAPAQPAAPTSGTANPTSSTQQPPASPAQNPAAGKVTITVAENHELFEFIKDGTIYRPFGPCEPVDNQTWVCPKPGSTAENPLVVVAVVVPKAQVQDLKVKAASGDAAERKRDWGPELPVPQ